MRLIDADKLIEQLEESKSECYSPSDMLCNGQINRDIILVENAPTVPLPDFKEGYKQAVRDGKTNFSRPQGEWIEGENGNIKCNRCWCEIRYSYLIGNKPDFPKFCCDCGSKMKGGAEND